MSHDLPPSNPDTPDDNTSTEADANPEAAEETPETKHRLWQAALRGIETEWDRVSPASLRDRLGAAIVATAFKEPREGLNLTFRRQPGQKKIPRKPWYKYSQNGEKEPDETT